MKKLALALALWAAPVAAEVGLGRYNIDPETIRLASRALGLPPDTKFSPNVQDALATWIGCNIGADYWRGLRRDKKARAEFEASMKEVRASGGCENKEILRRHGL